MTKPNRYILFYKEKLNYHWTYTGFAGYGHDMAIDSIIVDQIITRYIILRQWKKLI